MEYSLFCKLIFKFILDTVNISYYDYEIILNIDENKLDIIKKILQYPCTNNIFRNHLMIYLDRIELNEENMKYAIWMKNIDLIDYMLNKKYIIL